MLEHRLVVVARLALGDEFDFRPDVPLDKVPRRLAAAVQVDRRHQRLEDVGQERRRDARVRGHALAENEKLLHSQRFADLRARLPADDHRFDFRQVAFEVLRILVKEKLADDGAENRVAEKFQPLVGGQAMLRPRGVRQGRLQEQLVAKLIADAPLTIGQQGGQRGCGTNGLIVHAHAGSRQPPCGRGGKGVERRNYLFLAGKTRIVNHQEVGLPSVGDYV